MRTNSRQHLDSISQGDPTHLESLIREDWMAVAAARAVAAGTAKASSLHSTIPSAVSADPPPTVAGSLEGSEPHHDPGSTRRGTGVE